MMSKRFIDQPGDVCIGLADELVVIDQPGTTRVIMPASSTKKCAVRVVNWSQAEGSTLDLEISAPGERFSVGPEWHIAPGSSLLLSPVPGGRGYA
jgi:hypothetical protein